MRSYQIPEHFIPFFNRDNDPYFYLPDGQQVKLNFKQETCKRVWRQLRPGQQVNVDESDSALTELIQIFERSGIEPVANVTSGREQMRFGLVQLGKGNALSLKGQSNIRVLQQEELEACEPTSLDVVIVSSPWYDPKALAWFDALAGQKGWRWLPLYSDNGLTRFGPVLNDGIDFYTLHQRLLASSFNPPLLEDFWSYIQSNAICAALDEESRQWIVNTLVLLLKRLHVSQRDEAAASLHNHQATLNHVDLSLQFHPVLPLPVRRDHRPGATAADE